MYIGRSLIIRGSPMAVRVYPTAGPGLAAARRETFGVMDGAGGLIDEVVMNGVAGKVGVLCFRCRPPSAVPFELMPEVTAPAFG